MKDPLATRILAFLKAHLKDERPLLLGLSGGTDSLALFYLLLECQKQLPFQFAAAHIDHGWRPTSSQEAAELKDLVEKAGITFHSKKLETPKQIKNLEALGRQERHLFFKEICQTHGYQAVLLAHQLDDQAETVLKNIFEGASLIACNGIEECIKIDSLHIWRPLLKVPKKDLAAWLERTGKIPLNDITNFDNKYLRARMRGELIPHLESLFGKGVSKPLAEIGQEAQELKDFLHVHFNDILNGVCSGPIGSYLDFSPHTHLTPFEIKFLIRQICKKESCIPSKEIVEGAAAMLSSNQFNKQFVTGDHILFIDRRRLFVTNKHSMNQSQDSLILSCGETKFGAWNVQVEDSKEKPTEIATDWRALWSGKAAVCLPQPETPYQLSFSKLNVPYYSTTLHKLWNSHQIPPFLRQSIPVVFQLDTIVHEFLTGKSKHTSKKKDCWQKISLIGRKEG